MSETRRQLFRTSILSALGVMACKPGVMAAPPVASMSDPRNIGMIFNSDKGYIYLQPSTFGHGFYGYYMAPTTTWPDDFDLAKVSSTPNMRPVGHDTLTVVGPTPPAKLSFDDDSYISNDDLNGHNLKQLTWNEIGSKTR